MVRFPKICISLSGNDFLKGDWKHFLEEFQNKNLISVQNEGLYLMYSSIVLNKFTPPIIASEWNN